MLFRSGSPSLTPPPPLAATQEALGIRGPPKPPAAAPTATWLGAGPRRPPPEAAQGAAQGAAGLAAVEAACLRTLDRAVALGVQALQTRHEAAHAALLGRVDLSFGPSKVGKGQGKGQAAAAAVAGPLSLSRPTPPSPTDTAALALARAAALFAYGRYLLVAAGTKVGPPGSVGPLTSRHTSPPLI